MAVFKTMWLFACLHLWQLLTRQSTGAARPCKSITNMPECTGSCRPYEVAVTWTREEGEAVHFKYAVGVGVCVAASAAAHISFGNGVDTSGVIDDENGIMYSYNSTLIPTNNANVVLVGEAGSIVAPTGKRCAQSGSGYCHYTFEVQTRAAQFGPVSYLSFGFCLPEHLREHCASDGDVGKQSLTVKLRRYDLYINKTELTSKEAWRRSVLPSVPIASVDSTACEAITNVSQCVGDCEPAQFAYRFQQLYSRNAPNTWRRKIGLCVKKGQTPTTLGDLMTPRRVFARNSRSFSMTGTFSPPEQSETLFLLGKAALIKFPSFESCAMAGYDYCATFMNYRPYRSKFEIGVCMPRALKAACSDWGEESAVSGYIKYKAYDHFIPKDCLAVTDITACVGECAPFQYNWKVDNPFRHVAPHFHFHSGVCYHRSKKPNYLGDLGGPAYATGDNGAAMTYSGWATPMTKHVKLIGPSVLVRSPSQEKCSKFGYGFCQTAIELVPTITIGTCMPQTFSEICQVCNERYDVPFARFSRCDRFNGVTAPPNSSRRYS